MKIVTVMIEIDDFTNEEINHFVFDVLNNQLECEYANESIDKYNLVVEGP